MSKLKAIIAVLIFLPLLSDASVATCRLLFSSPLSQETQSVIDYIDVPMLPNEKSMFDGIVKKTDPLARSFNWLALRNSKKKSNLKKVEKILNDLYFTSGTLNGHAGAAARIEGQKNAAKAFEYLEEQLQSGQGLTEEFIFQLHSLYVSGKRIKKSEDFQYRNHGLDLGVAELVPIIAKDVPIAMTDLMRWYEANKVNMHPIELATRFLIKFVSIHPFGDGNGRTARGLMNFILVESGYPPPILHGTTNLSRAAVTFKALNFQNDLTMAGFEPVSVSETILQNAEAVRDTLNWLAEP